MKVSPVRRLLAPKEVSAPGVIGDSQHQEVIGMWSLHKVVGVWASEPMGYHVWQVAPDAPLEYRIHFMMGLPLGPPLDIIYSAMGIFHYSGCYPL